MLLFIANSTGSQAGTKTFSYDAFTARWTAIDPHASKYVRSSPYNYCFNNPMMYFDPSGLDGYLGSNGDYFWFETQSVDSFSDINHIEWTAATNSETNKSDALTSQELGNTGFQLKFYPSKGGDDQANSLGIVRSYFFLHTIEAVKEKVERIIYKDKADSDPLYDMHVKNARVYLKKTKQ